MRLTPSAYEVMYGPPAVLGRRRRRLYSTPYGCAPCVGYGQRIQQAEFARDVRVSRPPSVPPQKKSNTLGVVAAFGLLALAVGAGVYIITR